MKRNVNLLVLACEILAIVVLHALKISQAVPGSKTDDQNKSISKVTTLSQQASQFKLVSLK